MHAELTDFTLGGEGLCMDDVSENLVFERVGHALMLERVFFVQENLQKAR